MTAWRRHLGVVWPVILIVVSILSRMLVIHVRTCDQDEFLTPWLAHAKAAGSGYLARSFTNYTPIYEHVLALLALLPGPAMLRVKLFSILFDLVLALSIAMLVPRARRAGAFAVVLVTPTIMMNSAMLGQCDAIYGSMIVLSLLAAIQRRPIWTMLFFSVAIATKLQAVLFLPILAVLTLERRQPVWTYALIPVAYLAFAVPMLLAGRPPGETMLVYLHQFSGYHRLSLNAPNIWAILQKYVAFDDGAKIGLVFAALVVGGAILAIWRRGLIRSSDGLLHAAAFLLILAPYLAPKMHDRYFYLVDPVLIALAFRDRRYIVPLVLAELGSLMGYIAFMLQCSEIGTAPVTHRISALLWHWLHIGDASYAKIGAVFMTAALALLIRRALQIPASSTPVP